MAHPKDLFKRASHDEGQAKPPGFCIARPQQRKTRQARLNRCLELGWQMADGGLEEKAKARQCRAYATACRSKRS